MESGWDAEPGSRQWFSTLLFVVILALQATFSSWRFHELFAMGFWLFVAVYVMTYVVKVRESHSTKELQQDQ